MASLTLSPDELFACGTKAQTDGRLDVAVAAWRETLRVMPNHAAALYNLGVALTQTGDADAAATHYEKLLVCAPDHREGIFNLANLRLRGERVAEAKALYARLLKIHPLYVPGWINMGEAHLHESEQAAAEECFRQAIKIEPANVVAHWNLAQVLLQVQQWCDAWAEYEWRLKLPHWLQSPVTAPMWTPGSVAKNVLLWNDQGMGDALQFLRYPQFLAAKGVHIFVLVQDALKSIAATARGVAAAFGPSDALPQVEAQAPLLSLPHLLSLPEPSNIGPYVHTDKTFELSRRGRLAVGVVWAGNARFSNDKDRSASLKALAPLLNIPGIDFFSLQIPSAAREIENHGFANKVVDLAPRIHDFADTAAALNALDLVITVDTATAHLAGAMGRPCWVMLSTKPDWRWAGPNNSSLWYPSMRLYRQEAPGDWSLVIAKIAAGLKNLVEAKS